MSTLRSEVERLATIVESDALAATYQSLGQYRRDLLEVIRGALALPETEVEMSVTEAVAREREACALICDAEGREWDSDAVVTLKNYAEHCATSIRDRTQPEAPPL